MDKFWKGMDKDMKSEWRPITSFPDLRDAPEIAVDTETKDPGLMSQGPGAPFGEAHAIGFSIAVPGFKAYLPIRHEGGGNLAEEPVIKYMRHILSGPGTKVFANAGYDLEILRVDGIEIQGPIADIQVAEPLLDEDRLSYSLDNLAKAYLGEGKEESLLREAALNLGIDPRNIKAYLYKLPSSFVGQYAEVDAERTLQVWQKQKPRLEEEELMQVFDLEMDLIKVIFEMRWRGIPVDVAKGERIAEELANEQSELYDELVKIGGSVDIWSNVSISKAVNDLGLFVPKTELGNPSFESEFLEAQEHPFFQKLLKCRKLDRAGSVFIQSKILNLQKNGRMYPRYRQVRGDGKGTRSGRLSSEGPNFQQIPSRDEYLAPKVRSVFPPEEGEMYVSADCKAQEPRLTTHYGYVLNLAGAAEVREQYLKDPFTDYHNATVDLIKDKSGITIKRSQAKNINLGIPYGMGKKKLAESLGVDSRTAYAILDAYDKSLPFMKLLGERCTNAANSRGYIKTILGRRRHFNLWGPKKWSSGMVPKKYDEALMEYGEGIVRYFTYKGLNALIQGSSADQIKKAMVLCHKEKILPYLTLHDELLFSSADLNTVSKVCEILCECIPEITIPMASEIEIGPSWGEVTDKYKWSRKTGLLRSEG